MKLLALSICLILFATAPAQNDDRVYEKTDLAKPAFFWGGDLEYVAFFDQYLKYPEEALAQGIGGRVVVSTVVEKDGHLGELRILRGAGSVFGKAVRRVFEEDMPCWHWAEANGYPARMHILFNFEFYPDSASISWFNFGLWDAPFYNHQILAKVPPNEYHHMALPRPAIFPQINILKNSSGFINRRKKFPEEAFKNGVQVDVRVGFTVKKDGHLADIHLINDPGFGLGTEALRCARLMPRWIPAEACDSTFDSYKEIRVYFTVDSTFRTDTTLLFREDQLPDPASRTWADSSLAYPKHIQPDGVAAVSFTVGRDGHVADIELDFCTDSLAAHEALEYLRQQNSWPVAYCCQIPRTVCRARCTRYFYYRAADRKAWFLRRNPLEYPVPEDRIYDSWEVDRPAMYLSGQCSINEAIWLNLRYPEAALQNATEGTVLVSFVVSKRGEKEKPIQIIQDIGDGCGQAAVDLMDTLIYWKPALINSFPVRMRCQIPVPFTLPRK